MHASLAARNPSLPALGALLAGLLTACGPASEPTTATLRVVGDGFPRRVERPDGSAFELTRPPVRVMAANAGVLDALSLLVGPERLAGIASGGVPYSVALGRGAIDLTEAQRNLGHDSESVLDIAPDLLLMNAWQSLEQLEILDANAMPWVSLPEVVSFDDVLRNALLLGRLLGTEAEAQALVDDLEARRDALAAPSPRAGLRAIAYSNDGAGGFAMGPGTTHDVLLQLCGLENAARDFELDWHAPIDIESLLVLDPDVLVVPGPARGQLRSPTAQTLETDERLAELRAVRDGRVIQIPPLLFGTNSGYMIEAAELLAAELDARLTE